MSFTALVVFLRNVILLYTLSVAKEVVLTTCVHTIITNKYYSVDLIQLHQMFNFRRFYHMTYETRFVPKPFSDELCLILHTCMRLYCCGTSDIMILSLIVLIQIQMYVCDHFSCRIVFIIHVYSFVVNTHHFCSLCTLFFHCHVELGIIFRPVWSQFSTSSGGMSSIDTVATTSARNDFFSSFKVCYYFLTFGCGIFSLNKFHSCQKSMAQYLFSSIWPPIVMHRYRYQHRYRWYFCRIGRYRRCLFTV